jgi:hypothetical protein
MEMVFLNPNFKPSANYKPSVTHVSDEVKILQDECLEINLSFLLIGLRGYPEK